MNVIYMEMKLIFLGLESVCMFLSGDLPFMDTVFDQLKVMFPWL